MSVLVRKVKAIFASVILLLVMTLFQNCIEFDKSFKATNASEDPFIDESPNNEETPEEETGNIGGEENLSEKVPAFLAVGEQGSSMYSCDGGQTWKGYKELASQRCTDPNFDGNCDHSSLAGKSAMWTPSGFIVNYGHGTPGLVQKSSDGKNWETLLTDVSFGGTAYGNGTAVLARGNDPLYSDDDGENWESFIKRLPAVGNIRHLKFVPHGGGVFLSLNNAGEKQSISMSKDNGRTYSIVPNTPEGCSSGSLAYSDTRILLSSGNLCFSDDAGESWAVIEGAPSGSVIFDGDEFKLFSGNSVFSSLDGITWSESEILVDGGAYERFSASRLAFHSDIHKYVVISGKYEEMRYYHSSDGVNWQTLPANENIRPLAAHPVEKIISGYIKDCN